MQKVSLIVISMAVLSSCSNQYSQKGTQLTHVQIIDRNGVNETISQKERLEGYQKVDFLQAQPYQKVVRVFKRDEEGKLFSQLTTYHDNGEVFQYLEVVNGRAKGVYKEWYTNGKLRIVSHVMEGVGDLSPDAQTSWIFDGDSKVWDFSGNLTAELWYEKGRLEKEALYYYPNGRLSKTIPYKNDLPEGEKRIYDIEGNFVGATNYVMGQKEGRSFFIGDKTDGKKEEIFHKGLLVSAQYWDFEGKITHEIQNGRGIKAEYEEGFLHIEQEYIEGKPEGSLKIYRKNGDLDTIYHIIDGQKQGEELCYFERKLGQKELTLMMQIHWRDDEIHGVVRTWYPNGRIESEREMAKNQKQGKYLAWYEDGSLMMIEEYENDVLQSGKYLKKGEEFPVSRVMQGSGIATFYDARGNFLRKTEYQKGIPIE